MATKQSASDSGDSKGWKMPGWLKLIVVLAIGYVVLRIGVSNILDTFDPGGGADGLLARAPRVIHNLGLLAAFIGGGSVLVGIVMAIWKGWKDHGHHAIGYGLLAAGIGILGPPMLMGGFSDLPALGTNLLDSLRNIDWSGIRLK